MVSCLLQLVKQQHECCLTKLVYVCDVKLWTAKKSFTIGKPISYTLTLLSNDVAVSIMLQQFEKVRQTFLVLL